MVKPTKKKTDVKQEVLFLGKLLEELLRGKIRIPRFQRPFVWRQADMLRLLDSVALGYPIGSILLFDALGKVSSQDRVGPISIEPNPSGTVSYLLDGQQRLSTLAGCLLLDESRDDVRAENVDWVICYNLKSSEFSVSPKEGLGPEHFPVNCLLSTARFLGATREIEKQKPSPRDLERYLAVADDLANAFRNYQIPVITVHDTEVDVAVQVVTRLNRRGRRMSADQIISALTYREGSFNLAERFDQLQADFEARGFGGLDRIFMLRTVLAAQGRDIYAKDWENLSGGDAARDHFANFVDDASRGMHAALDFLETLGVTSDRLLPYGLQFVMLAEALRLNPSPSERVRSLLEQWFWVTSFTAWFGGVNTAQARGALGEIREVARGTRETFKVVNLTAPSEPFPSRFDTRSARVRAFMLFLASLEPRSVRDVQVDDEPERLDVAELLTVLGHRALRHVVANLGDQELQRSPANRMFVDREHRGQTLGSVVRTLGAEVNGPIFSSNNMTNKGRVFLVSHGFPLDVAERLFADDRVGVIRGRLQALIEGERQFMKACGVVLPRFEQADVIADSDVSSDEDEDYE